MTYTQDIVTAIVNKLSGVSNLNGVYATEIPTPTNGQYPFATVTIKRGTGEFGDTIRNIRKLNFDINFYQERTATGQGPTISEAITNRIIDEVLTAFDNDTTLSGLVKYITPVSFDANYVDREMGDTRFVQFNVEATVVVPSTP